MSILIQIANALVRDGATAITIIGTLLLIGSYVYLKPGEALQKFLRKFGIGIATAYIALALIASMLQYWLWTQATFTQFFLPPHQPISYYLGYIAMHFWLKPVLGIGLALLWYVFLYVVKHHKDRYFEGGETELAAIAFMLVSWPLVIVLFPIFAVSVLAVSIGRFIIAQERYTTFGIPILVATAVTLLLGNQIMLFILRRF